MSFRLHWPRSHSLSMCGGRCELVATSGWMISTTMKFLPAAELCLTSSRRSSSTSCWVSSCLSGSCAVTTGCCRSGRPTTARRWPSRTRGAPRQHTSSLWSNCLSVMWNLLCLTTIETVRLWLCADWSNCVSATDWWRSSYYSLGYLRSVSKSGPAKSSSFLSHCAIHNSRAMTIYVFEQLPKTFLKYSTHVYNALTAVLTLTRCIRWRFTDLLTY